MITFISIYLLWIAVAYLMLSIGFPTAAAIVAAPAMYLLWMAFSLVALIIGLFPVIPILALLPTHTVHSEEYPDGRLIREFFLADLFYFWGNEEDGIDGLPEKAGVHTVFQNQTWGKETEGWSRWRRIFVWSAWRNSVNNQRFMWPFRLRINPTRVRIKRFSRGYFIWQGLYSAIYVTIGSRYIHIGYKLHQDDFGTTVALPITNTRRPGAGFVVDIFKSINPTSWQTPKVVV